MGYHYFYARIYREVSISAVHEVSFEEGSKEAHTDSIPANSPPWVVLVVRHK